LNIKRLAVMAHKAVDIMSSWRYWNKTPGQIVAMRRKKLAQDRACRQRRKRWRYVKRRYPATSHRRN
jgi:hypothetical protein